MRARLEEDAARAGAGTVLCRNCRFCTTVCPVGVRIPDVMTMINLSVAAGSDDVRSGDLLRRAYEARTAGGPASACVGCHACDGRCPQAIPIIWQMARAALLFER